MSDYIDYVRDQLRGVPGYTVRRMFGGNGLFWQGLMFGLVAGDTLYFRTDARNRADYESLGLTPFKPWEDRKIVLKAYYPVPEDVLEDVDEIKAWARKAIDAALADGVKKPAAKPKAKAKRKTS
jgi:DNA transformation protein